MVCELNNRMQCLVRTLFSALCAVMLGCDVQMSDEPMIRFDTCLVRNAVIYGGDQNFAEISNLCDQIDGLVSEQDRFRNFRMLIDEAMSVDFADICQGSELNDESRNDEVRMLGLAYSNVRMIVEEVHTRLFIREEPPIEQLYPWLMLIKKMKSEDLRTRSDTSHSRAYIKVVEHRFERCLREGKFRSGDEIDAVRKLYFEAVGHELPK